MSKPTQTGEWTAAEVVMMGCTGQAAYDIAHAHNAALAAEREKYRQEAVALEQMAGRYNRDVAQLSKELEEARKVIVGIAEGDTSVDAETFANDCIFTCRAFLAKYRREILRGKRSHPPG